MESALSLTTNDVVSDKNKIGNSSESTQSVELVLEWCVYFKSTGNTC